MSKHATDATFECGHPRTEENTAVLRGKFEYCRICIRQSANERYRAKHPGAKQRVYLSLDAMLDALIRKTPEHWLWQGSMRAVDSSAVAMFSGKTYFIAKTLWERENGPVPPRHCLYRTCPLSRCVRPRCHQPAVRASHITDANRGVRGKPIPDYAEMGVGRPIYGMSPERAAIFGLIDDEQYLSRYQHYPAALTDEVTS